MGRTLQSALCVVKPYGASDMTFSPTKLIPNGNRRSKEVQTLLKEYKDQGQEDKYATKNLTTSLDQSSIGALQSRTSIFNFCSNISYCLNVKEPGHLENITRIKNKSLVYYHPAPPHNSFIEDSTTCKYEPSVMESTDQLFKKPISRNASRLRQRKSCFLFEFDKVCKMLPLLPNPVSKLLYDEMNERKLKKNELKQLRTMPCYSEHMKQHEPLCVTYFSPKPSQMLLHRSVDTLERNADKLRRRNATSQYPLSTVEVFCKVSSKYTVPELLRELQHYGNIERIVRCSKRSFKVVYSDLTAACEAVTGLKYNMNLFCTWYHRQLQERKFVQFGKDPLKVLIYKL